MLSPMGQPFVSAASCAVHSDAATLTTNPGQCHLVFPLYHPSREWLGFHIPQLGPQNSLQSLAGAEKEVREVRLFPWWKGPLQ